MLQGLQDRFRDEFLKTASGRLERAGAALDTLASDPIVRNEMHALAGEAALIGFQEVAEAARAAEKLAKAALAGDVVALGKCARAFRKVRQAVATLADGKRRTALIVDDSDLVREQLELALRGRGFEVRTAATGDEALASADDSIDLVVADLNLPGITCAELVARLRETSPRAHIALVSGLDPSELAEKANEVGADSYVSKVQGLEAIAEKLAAASGARGG